LRAYAAALAGTACARRARRFGRALLAIVALLAAVAAAADTLPPALRIAHRLTENLPDLLRGLERFAPVVGAVVDEDQSRRCAAVAWDAVCGALSVGQARQAARRCRDVLSAADAALARATPPADTMPALAITSFRQRISSEAFRLSSLLRVLALEGCAEATRTLADETVGLTLLDGGRTVLVEPDRGLAPGAAYAIRDHAGATLRPSRTGTGLADLPELAAARALARRLDASAEHTTTWPGMPAFSVTLPEPAERAPFWPAPVRLVRSGSQAGSSFETSAAPATPAEPEECPPGSMPADDVLAALDARATLGAVRRGVLPPAPQVGRPEAVPFLLALPRQPARGVVLLLHSLGANARVILASLAAALGDRALASVALDLPQHGERPAGPAPFLDPADPATFAAHAAQARREILALVQTLRRCPAAIGLPAGLPVDHVGLFGYSIGATLGLLALAGDAGITPVVLNSPAADVFAWQRLLVARHVGLLRRVCVGAAHGPTCMQDGACGDGSPCDHHPGIWLLTPAVGPAYRLLVGDVEPMASAALLRPPRDARPLLVQGAADDLIVFPTITRRVGDALDLPEVAAGATLPRRGRRMWPGGHGFLGDAPVRAEAAAFLAQHWNDARAPLR